MPRDQRGTGPEAPAFGRSVPRREGRAKLEGRGEYVDDLVLPDMWFGATIRSRVARGKIEEIVFAKDVPWDEYVIVTARDIPGKNSVLLLLEDQPYLADGVVNHPEEAVLLVAHPDRHALERARRGIEIRTSPLPPLFDLEDSLAKKLVIWGEDNVFKAIDIVKGDVDSAFRDPSLVVVEGVYHTGAQEQLYIEPNGVIAAYDAKEGVTVWGSLQCPYYVHKALKPLFGLSPDKIRVIQMETGGGFGGKEEYPSMIAGHAALLAYKANKPVKLIYDRAEDMVATTKRHPSRTRHRTAVTKAGKLVAMDIDFALDGGAYATLSAVVLSRGAIHAGGAYECPNVRIKARAVATNHPPHGAFRGFGAPQSIFAVERQLDLVAKTLGMSPEALRRANFLQRGGHTATIQEVKEDPELDRLMQRAFELSGYAQKRPALTAQNAAAKTGRIRKGIGFASFMHGAGFTGSGEKLLGSEAAVEATPDGRVRVLAASTEIGQGTNTVFAQIVADALGLPYDAVEVAQPDTKFVPDSGPTVASRTVMVVGKLVENAAKGLKGTLREAGLLEDVYDHAAFRTACGAYLAKHAALKSVAKYQQPTGIVWDDKKYLGDAYATFAWAVYVAEVSIDLDTYATTVDDFWAIQEAGRIVHPILAAGQIEGGVAQGVGFALYEGVVWKEGRMANASMTNYIVPTAVDAPRIHVEFVEKDAPYGPGRGAKGIGELPMDGAAPAIAAAMEHALGIAVTRVPCLPEDLFALLEGGRS